MIDQADRKETIDQPPRSLTEGARLLQRFYEGNGDRTALTQFVGRSSFQVPWAEIMAATNVSFVT